MTGVQTCALPICLFVIFSFVILVCLLEDKQEFGLGGLMILFYIVSSSLFYRLLFIIKRCFYVYLLGKYLLCVLLLICRCLDHSSDDLSFSMKFG